MFRRFGLMSSLVAIAILLAGPVAYADPMPALPDVNGSDVDAEIVAASLVETGLEPAEVETVLECLTAGEIACLAEQTDRIQMAGNLTYWWEGFWGALWFGGALGFAVAIADNAN